MSGEAHPTCRVPEGPGLAGPPAVSISASACEALLAVCIMLLLANVSSA